jgi:hypothetical protein
MTGDLLGMGTRTGTRRTAREADREMKKPLAGVAWGGGKEESLGQQVRPANQS